MADPAGGNSDQDLGRTDLWEWSLGIFQRFPELDQSNSSHNPRDQRAEVRVQVRETVRLMLMLMLVLMIEISFAVNAEHRTVISDFRFCPNYFP